MNELLSVLFYIYLFTHIKILLDSINMCSNNIFATFSDFTTLFLFKFDDIKILTTLIFHGIIPPHHLYVNLTLPLHLSGGSFFCPYILLNCFPIYNTCPQLVKSINQLYLNLTKRLF